MIDPIFWLGLSILLVAISLTALLVVAIPAFQELGRAARSAEKLFDTLHRELPPTLEAIRLTGLEITDLTDDMSQGVQSAGQVAKQVDQSLTGVKQQVQKAHTTSRSLFAGVKAAWQTLTEPGSTKSRRTERSIAPRSYPEPQPKQFQETENASLTLDAASEQHHAYPAEMLGQGVYPEQHLDSHLDSTVPELEAGTHVAELEAGTHLIQPIKQESDRGIKRENGKGSIDRSSEDEVSSRLPARRESE